jgi:UDP-N-acetylglucosamine diphosphorylase/glucosamine-1-phosphate N-acetyltransferase
MNYILFDDFRWDNLLPLTFTRPSSEIRIGILTIREKWERILGTKCSWLTKDYLSEKYPVSAGNGNILLNGTILPNSSVLQEIRKLMTGQALEKENTILAVRSDEIIDCTAFDCFKDYDKVKFNGEFLQLNHPWDIFTYNGDAIRSDFELLTNGKKTGHLSKTNTLLNPQNIFVEEGVKAESVTLNASTGPIYLGRNSEIMEGSTIRGPFALCENSTVKMGGKIYGPTTIGPSSKVGGEINNSVIIGYSNKAHDGFLGNSVIGEWCNIGADSNNSNLKNTYGPVRLWSYPEEKFIHTGLTFCGLIMGDHSKCGINTMFNTGTVVGVSANIFGSGFPRNFIPSFSWGGPQGYFVYKPEQAFEVAKEVMSKRNIEFDEKDRKILQTIFEMTKKYRTIGITH